MLITIIKSSNKIIHCLTKKFLFIILILGLSVCKSSKTDAENIAKKRIYKVTTSQLRIRKEASINSEVIGTLSKGTLVNSQLLYDYNASDRDQKKYIPNKTDNVDGKNGEWIIVFVDNDGMENRGYIFSGYLEDVTSEYHTNIYCSMTMGMCKVENNFLDCPAMEKLNIAERSYDLNKINRITFITSTCSHKVKVYEYDNYFKVKDPFGISIEHWIMFISNKTKQVEQILYSVTDFECD